jgi:cytochrome c peroxidase
VNHYNEGIQNHPSLDWQLREFDQDTGATGPVRLNLDELEKSALVAFLKTLTDEDYVRDVRFSNPFK